MDRRSTLIGFSKFVELYQEQKGSITELLSADRRLRPANAHLLVRTCSRNSVFEWRLNSGVTPASSSSHFSIGVTSTATVRVTVGETPLSSSSKLKNRGGFLLDRLCKGSSTPQEDTRYQEVSHRLLLASPFLQRECIQWTATQVLNRTGAGDSCAPPDVIAP